MKILIFIILLFAGIVYIIGLFKAVHYSRIGEPQKMHSRFRQFVTGIGGALATNLGVVLGIDINQATDSQSYITTLNIAAAADTPSFLQLAAAYIYVLGLIYIFYSWWRLKWEEDPNKVVVILPQFAQTLFGVVLGVMAVYLAGS